MWAGSHFSFSLSQKILQIKLPVTIKVGKSILRTSTYILPPFPWCKLHLLCCKMIASLLSIKIRVHMIDNSNDEIRGGGVKRDACGDEKQLIKFTWPYYILVMFNDCIEVINELAYIS